MGLRPGEECVQEGPRTSSLRFCSVRIVEGENSGWPGSMSKYATLSNFFCERNEFVSILVSVDFPEALLPAITITGGFSVFADLRLLMYGFHAWGMVRISGGVRASKMTPKERSALVPWADQMCLKVGAMFLMFLNPLEWLESRTSVSSL